MIDRLRNRFIRIATLSVAAVMLLLTVILNAANFISTDRDLRDTLTLIYENEGTIPTARRAETDGGQTPPEKPEAPEAPPEQPGGDGEQPDEEKK